MCVLCKPLKNTDRFHYIKFLNAGTVKSTTEKRKEQQQLWSLFETYGQKNMFKKKKDSLQPNRKMS